MRTAVPLLTCVLLAGAALAADPPAALEETLRSLHSPDLATRVRAADRLGRCGGRPECVRAVRALERAVFDPEQAVRRAALNALVSLEARSSAGVVVQLLASERDPRVLPAALFALGKLAARGAFPRLVPFASHPAPAVRAAAVAAAGALGGPDARRLVLNSLQMAGEEDADWLVRSSALLALARIGKRSDLAAARRAFREGDGQRSWLARSALARVTASLSPDPQPQLERLLMDRDPRVAVTAAAGLAEAGLVDVLLMHLGNAQPSIRAAAVGGVRQGRVARAYPRLRRMARWDPAREVRWAAAVALFELDDPCADELMLDALASREPAIWAEAVALLARRTGAAHGRDVQAWRRELRRLRGR